MEDARFESGLGFARGLDVLDDLASFRNAFVISEPDLIYLDGNSLGRLPKQTVGRVQMLVEGAQLATIGAQHLIDAVTVKKTPIQYGDLRLAR